MMCTCTRARREVASQSHGIYYLPLAGLLPPTSPVLSKYPMTDLGYSARLERSSERSSKHIKIPVSEKLFGISPADCNISPFHDPPLISTPH